MGAEARTLAENRLAIRRWIGYLLIAACGFIAGLSLSRLLYEGWFPTWSSFGRPLPAMVLGAVFAALCLAGVWLCARRWGVCAAPAVLPLLLNLIWLIDPAVELARGRFLFVAAWWLAAVILIYLFLGDGDGRWRWIAPLLLVSLLAPTYLLTMSHAVGAADTFEFQVVAPQLGIAHPTGYPLYLLLGKLFSLLPLGTTAWRINLASATYATLATIVVFHFGLRLLKRPLPALTGAVALGTLPIFWSQAIIAEVYTLHALIVAAALLLMLRLIDNRPVIDERVTLTMSATDDGLPGYWDMAQDRKTMVGLALLLGLGLTNHLTTVCLLPAGALAILINLWPRIRRRRPNVSRRRPLVPLLFQLLVAFLVPLLLYAYLPLRWAALNNEPMGLARFIDWVVAGRFQGALQWGAWLHDPTRRQIVARFFLGDWGWFYLALALVGALWLVARRWRVALILFVTASGFTFYTLNYYVPDLAVFLIPAHVVVAIQVATGGAALVELAGRYFRGDSRRARAGAATLFLLIMLPMIVAVGAGWPAIDQSRAEGGETWARGALQLPLTRGGTILADSEKIAPLYYLQQIEGLRPDLDIIVLPDEASYRAELDARLAAGGVVYLARYLPGLQGLYYLRSAGPLVEVSREPLTALPADAIPSNLTIEPLRLLGYEVDPHPNIDPDATAITLYWQLQRPLAEGELLPVIYWRWDDDQPVVTGRHAVNDSYPVNAWRPGEIIVDTTLLPAPYVACGELDCAAEAQVAVAPRFTPAAELDWHTIATVPIAPRRGPIGQARRALFEGFALDGIDIPAVVRPDDDFPLRFSGFGDGSELIFTLAPAGSPIRTANSVVPRLAVPAGTSGSVIHSTTIKAAAAVGRYHIVVTSSGGALCGWLARPTTACVLGEIAISGAPLADGAINFDDKIALLAVHTDGDEFIPGGRLPVTLTWQGLTPMGDDYTVFVQVLDANDRIVGQVDAWPVQGTRPTSSWRPGEIITDPIVVQLNPDIATLEAGGVYRLHVGLYLLATGQRLPILDDAGNAIDDKVEIAIPQE